MLLAAVYAPRKNLEFLQYAKYAPRKNLEKNAYAPKRWKKTPKFRLEMVKFGKSGNINREGLFLVKDH